MSSGFSIQPERETVTDEPQDAIPEGWRDRPEPADDASDPQDDRPDPGPEPEDDRPESGPRGTTGRWAGFTALTLLAASAALVVWILLPGAPSHDRTAAPSAAPVIPATPEHRPDLTTPDRLRTLVADLKRRTGGTEVVFLHVSAGHASATVRLPGDTSDKPFESHTYQSGKGWSSYRSHGGSDGDERIPEDLSKIDWNILDELYPEVDEKLALPGKPERTLTLKAGLNGDRFDLPFEVRDTPAELSVELNDGTRVGWVEARTNGAITKVNLPVQYAFSPRPGSLAGPLTSRGRVR
ncbi:hypothetical protein ACFYUH_16315 [Streptomyces fimicarius]|uniref:hypothetical protein n=1 Tax=Streptomyces griseus TaxID=1911 RepID=UPI00367C8D26